MLTITYRDALTYVMAALRFHRLAYPVARRDTRLCALDAGTGTCKTAFASAIRRTLQRGVAIAACLFLVEQCKQRPLGRQYGNLESQVLRSSRQPASDWRCQRDLCPDRQGLFFRLQPARGKGRCVRCAWRTANDNVRIMKGLPCPKAKYAVTCATARCRNSACLKPSPASAVLPVPPKSYIWRNPRSPCK